MCRLFSPPVGPPSMALFLGVQLSPTVDQWWMVQALRSHCMKAAPMEPSWIWLLLITGLLCVFFFLAFFLSVWVVTAGGCKTRTERFVHCSNRQSSHSPTSHLSSELQQLAPLYLCNLLCSFFAFCSFLTFICWSHPWMLHTPFGMLWTVWG